MTDHVFVTLKKLCMSRRCLPRSWLFEYSTPMFEVIACLVEKDHCPTVVCPPLPKEITPPQGRITGYFGRRERVALLQFARQQFMSLNKLFYRADLLLDVKTLRSRQNWENVGHSPILNLTTICVDFDYDLACFAAQQSGLRLDDETGGKLILDFINKDTGIINILFNHPSLTHIKVIVWGA